MKRNPTKPSTRWVSRCSTQPTILCIFKENWYKVDSLTLNSEAVVIDETGKSLAEPYFVINVKNSIVVAPDHLSEISGQKMATLLSQISSQESGAARTLDFLQDTLDSYRTFKLIERYHQLKSRASRTPEEQVRLDEIFKEVKDYVK